jgi:ABC-type uncharacterized transport system substrate-binding protein
LDERNEAAGVHHVAWRRGGSVAARAQQREHLRRVGVLMHLAADDPEGQSHLAAFLQGLQEAGWAVGRNVTIDVRWAAADNESMKRFANELVALQPDLIFVTSTPATAAMLQATRTIPVVFVLVADPVGSRFVEGLPRVRLWVAQAFEPRCLTFPSLLANVPNSLEGSQ